MRHIQLLSVLPGKFILPLLSRRMISCNTNDHVGIAYVISVKEATCGIDIPILAHLKIQKAAL